MVGALAGAADSLRQVSVRAPRNTRQRHRQNVTVCLVFIALGVVVTVLNLGSHSGDTVRDSPWLGIVGVLVFGGLLVRELLNPDDPI